jgi:carbonic anhydrase
MEVHRRTPERRPYPPARYNALLLSCMDLRLIDDIVDFMEGDNMSNRYDQLVFAGAALGVMQPKHTAWREVFFQHLDIAVQLHGIRDVYIIEHRNCGAYSHFLGPEFVYDDSPTGMRLEEDEHRKHAFALRDAIHEHCARRRDEGGDHSLWDIRVRAFLMDLRGSVRLLTKEDAEYDA